MADIDKITVNNTTYNIKDSTARDSISLVEIYGNHTVNGGYFSISGMSQYRMVFIQQSYKPGIVMKPWAFVVQRIGDNVNVYVRDIDGSAAPDDTVVCVAMLAIK